MVHPDLNVHTFYSHEYTHAIAVDKSGSWTLFELPNYKELDSYYRPYKRQYKRSPRQMAKTAQHILGRKGIAPSEELVRKTERAYV